MPKKNLRDAAKNRLEKMNITLANMEETAGGFLQNEAKDMTTLKANHVRDKDEFERDLLIEAEMYLQCKTLDEISDYISSIRNYRISRTEVWQDMDKIKEIWRNTYLDDMDQIKATELARVDALERAYWKAWELSLAQKEMKHVTTITDAFGQDENGKERPGYKRSKQEIKKETRDGDVRFLQGIQWCIEQRCKVYGFNAPQKLSIDWRKEAESHGINPGELFDEVVDAFLKDAESNVDGTDDGGGVA